MVNIRINEGKKKANIKGHCIVQQALCRNVTNPHGKFLCEFVNTDFLIFLLSISHSVFTVAFHSLVVSQGRGNPASHHPQIIPGRQTGNHLMQGLLNFSGAYGLLHPFTAGSVQLLMVRASQLCCGVVLSCSIAPVPHLFLWSVSALKAVLSLP